MSLVGFMQAGNTSVYAGSWRHPATEHGFLDARYYPKLGRTLEEGCFDLMFFDDRLAMPGIYGGSVAEAVHYGARPVKLDLSIVLGVVAQATSRIGLGATYSTTYYSPFHVARTFATLDHLSGGRAAWNVVTSVNDSEAQNFGLDEHLGHDERYDRADEFLEATTGLWDTWEDDALVLDRVNGIFADPDKVHELNHEGEWFYVRGPLTVPRTPQGRPVLHAGRVVGPRPRVRGPLGRADLHRRPRHRGRPHPLRGPEGAHRRRGPRPAVGQDAARWPTRSSASPRPTPRSASSSSSTTWSTRWRR